MFKKLKEIIGFDGALQAGFPLWGFFAGHAVRIHHHAMDRTGICHARRYS
jgi:hypothetical protein